MAVAGCRVCVRLKVGVEFGAVYVLSVRDNIKREQRKSLMCEDKVLVKYAGLDAYGRTVAPDVNRFRVKMIDSAGNFLMTFGEYGGRDSAGPKSAIPVPEIPLWEANALGISDRSIYVYDWRHHRILCVNLKYAAEREVALETK